MESTVAAATATTEPVGSEPVGSVAISEPAGSEPAGSEPVASEPGAGDTAAGAPDVLRLLTGSGEGTWMLVSRSEKGSAPAAVECANDDLLIFKASGKFDSLIGGTKCNPQEVEVKDGTFALAADNKVITFTAPQLTYTGTLQVATANRIIIEFDLGTTKVTDEFILKR